MVLCLGEFPVRFLLLFISDLHFIFVSSFHFCIFIFVVALHLSLFFIHLLFDIIPHPSMEYITGFLHPFYTFSPARRRVIRNTFVFNYSGIFLPRALRFLSERFLPTGFFYLTLLHRHFWLSCVYQGLPGSRKFFLEVCRASYWSSKHRPSLSVCLSHSNPQSSYSERIIFKFFHIL